MSLQQCQQLNTPPAGCGASFVEQKEPLNPVRGCLCCIWPGIRHRMLGHPPGSLRVSVVPLRPTCQRLANDSKAMRQSACWGHLDSQPDGRSSTLLGRAGLCSTRSPGDVDPWAFFCLVPWTCASLVPASACRENPGKSCFRGMRHGPSEAKAKAWSAKNSGLPGRAGLLNQTKNIGVQAQGGT